LEIIRKIFSIFAAGFESGRKFREIMEKTKVLFVTQEITPYLKDSHMGMIGR